MKKEFVPYELAVKLKELGFKENCIRYYDSNMNLVNYFNLSTTIAPLWQQAFDWFRINHNLHVNIICGITNYTYDIIRVTDFASELGQDFVEYEEARQACLEKLIEIVENEKIQN